MRKKYYGAGLIVVAGALLCGCASREDASVGNAGNVMEEITEETDAVEKREAETGSEDKTAQAAGTDVQKNTESDTEGQADNAQEKELDREREELTGTDALTFVEDMKIGWNLGNTFDAIDYGGLGNELLYESCWCGTVTTKEMIDTLKEAGFQTIRIPVSWHNHLTAGVDGYDYAISEAWINRVQEVVDYAIEDDMYVIINIHHDFSKEYIYPSNEYLQQSKQYVTDIWRQVAEQFKDYDEHLIMESLNEPRLVGTNYEWWLNMQSGECIEAVQCINTLNQAFVDVVRASGGGNATRYLMAPGYAASLQGATNDYFCLPEDTVENRNKILVSVHAYTPYSFALQDMKESGSTDAFNADEYSSTRDIDDLMDNLYHKFIQNGTGVVIGEFGAREKNNNLQARVDFTAYYVEAARARGITCCVWDNNAFSGSGENFGLFDRKSLTFAYPEILESLMSHCE